MNQSAKPPRILFVRPKSAGSVRSSSQVLSSITPAPCASKTSAPVAPPISVAGSNPPQPVRPVNNNTTRRPSSAVGSRRCFTTASVAALPQTRSARGIDNNIKTCSWQQQDTLDSTTLPGLDVANIYRVVVARKEAEDAAQHLVRRIAHFRAQEERVLREMQTMRAQLGTSLSKSQKKPKSSANIRLHGYSTANSCHNSTVDPNISRNAANQTEKSASSKWKRGLKVPRSREQREFLAKQKRALEVHKLEAARQQKERQKLALVEQKAKEAEQDRRRRCRKMRMRAEEQQVIEQRIEKQRQIREAATKQHYERLMAEKQREHEALNLVTEMEEEERNLRVRLEALHFHREYMGQELHGSVPQHDQV